MARSERLTLRDIRSVFRLIGECRELGLDSTLWQRHMLSELRRLTGGQVAMAGPTGVPNELSLAEPGPAMDFGWEGERERGAFLEFLRDRVHREDPAIKAFGAQLVARAPRQRSLTRSREQLVDDRTWYRSVAFCEYRRRSRVDDGLMSVVALADGKSHGLALFRALNKQRFTSRDRRLLRLFHAELAPLLVGDLAPPGCDPLSNLSPRLRDVLACLLAGDSEQQVALQLGLTRDTTHQYVKALYRRLHVSSRGELMARFVRFSIRNNGNI
jgi:DNA-binding CsgD family transcriptional regulator